jgi:hypothetical protein
MNIKEIEENLNEQRRHIVSAYPDRIFMDELAGLMASEYPDDYLSYMGKKLETYIDRMAISARVAYIDEDKTFTVRFSDSDRKVVFSVESVIAYQYSYQKSFFESMKAKLMFNLVYKAA